MRKFWFILMGLVQVTAVIWLVWFFGYHRPAPHPSPEVVVPKVPEIPQIQERTTIRELPPVAPLPNPVPPPETIGPASVEHPPRAIPPETAPAVIVAPPPAVDSRPCIAVYPLTIVDTATNEETVNTGLGQQYAGRIEDKIDLSRFRVFDRGHLPELIHENELKSSDYAAHEGRIAKNMALLGVQQLVVGKVFVSKDGAGRQIISEIQAKREDTRTGEVLGRGSATAAGSPDSTSFIELANQMGLHEGAVPQHAPVAHNDAGVMTQSNLEQSFSVQIRTREGKTVYREGEPVSFEVKSDLDCYITLISEDSAGLITQLLPNSQALTQDFQFLKKGDWKAIPWEGSNFQFAIEPPDGRMVVRVIASRNGPIKFKGIDQNVIKADGFVPLNRDEQGNTRSIGLVIDPKPAPVSVKSAPPAPHTADSIQGQLRDLPADQWTTGELILTVRERESAPSTTHAPATSPSPTPEVRAPLPATQPATVPTVTAPTPTVTPPAASARDPNDALLDRWSKMTAGNSTASAVAPHFVQLSILSKGVGANAPPPTEFLVFRRAKAVGAKSVTGGNVAGSLVGDMNVQPIKPNGAKGLGAKDLNDDVAAQIEAIKKDPEVVAVVPNITIHCFARPSTKLSGVQWALQNDLNGGNDTGWFRAADEIMNIKTPLIGVVDQGLNIDDSRLAALAWTNPGEIAGNGIDDDHNGLIDDVHGYNFVNNTASLFDPKGAYNHGSMCASIIAGHQTGNDRDVIGIAPQAKIVVAVVMTVPAGHTGEAAQGDLKAILRGIDYVAACGAKVINLSLGGSLDQKGYEEICKLPIWAELERRGIILVCAAGNDYADNDHAYVFPASIRRSNIVTVMAVDPAGKLARALDDGGKWKPFSNYGATTVDIAAPGSLILGVPANGEARLDSGTSFSAPMVTGAIALVMGKHPDWTHRQVIQAVLKTAHAAPELQGKCVTGGTLDVAAALQANP